MSEISMALLYLEGLAREHMTDRDGDQRGDVVQNVIWIALFAAAAIAIATIIIVKFTKKAKSVPTG